MQRKRWLRLDSPSGKIDVYICDGLDVSGQYIHDKAQIEIRRAASHVMTMTLLHEILHVAIAHLSGSIRKRNGVRHSREELIVSLFEPGLYEVLRRSGLLNVPAPPKARKK